MEVITVDRLIGFNDDIVSLANTDEKPLCSERLDGDEVGRDDSQIVAIETDFEVVVGRCVDYSKPVLLTFYESIALVSSSRWADVCPIDQNVVGPRAATNQTTR